MNEFPEPSIVQRVPAFRAVACQTNLAKCKPQLSFDRRLTCFWQRNVVQAPPHPTPNTLHPKLHPHPTPHTQTFGRVRRDYRGDSKKCPPRDGIHAGGD